MCVVVGPACGRGVGGGLVRRGVPVLFIGSLRLRHTGLMRHVRAGGCRASGFVGGVVSGAGGCRLGVVGDGLLADVHGLEVSLGLSLSLGVSLGLSLGRRRGLGLGRRRGLELGRRRGLGFGRRRGLGFGCRRGLELGFGLGDGVGGGAACAAPMFCTTWGRVPRPWCVLHDHPGVVQHTPRSCRSTGVVRCRRPLHSTGQKHALISTGQKRALMPTPRPKVPRSRWQPAYPVPGGVVAVVWSLRARMLTVCQDTPGAAATWVRLMSSILVSRTPRSTAARVRTARLAAARDASCHPHAFAALAPPPPQAHQQVRGQPPHRHTSNRNSPVSTDLGT